MSQKTPVITDEYLAEVGRTLSILAPADGDILLITAPAETFYGSSGESFKAAMGGLTKTYEEKSGRKVFVATTPDTVQWRVLRVGESPILVTSTEPLSLQQQADLSEALQAFAQRYFNMFGLGLAIEFVGNVEVQEPAAEPTPEEAASVLLASAETVSEPVNVPPQSSARPVPAHTSGMALFFDEETVPR